MCSGWGLEGLDGTAWYHPLRLTIDSGAVAAGNRNPAQRTLGLRAVHGRDLPERLRILASPRRSAATGSWTARGPSPASRAYRGAG